MSCLGPNYNPRPPREWYRFENQCAYSDAPLSILNGGAYLLEVNRKGNVLQYKKNSANITKNQRYAQIARGMWTNRTTTWATQTIDYTNPNTNSLRRVGYAKINTNNPILDLNLNAPVVSYLATTLPLTCPTLNTPTFQSLPTNSGTTSASSDIPIIPPKYNPPTTAGENDVVLPALVNDNKPPVANVIPDGGTLICTISENICTGEVYRSTTIKQCNPTSDSDVPGPIIELCYNSNLPTYYPKERRVFSAGGNKWPQGEKFLFSANGIRQTNNP
jgi:hypothetical protein